MGSVWLWDTVLEKEWKEGTGASSLKIPPTGHLTKGVGRRETHQQRERRLSPGPARAADGPGTGSHRTSSWTRVA